MQIKVEDDRFIEGLSFEVWGSTNYWDILMALNNMTRIDELPVNYDIILKRVDKSLYEWKKLMELTKGGLTASKIDEKYKELLKEEEEKNEKFRYLNYISISDLSELIGELGLLREIPRINSNLIINKSDIE
jgi:hypothetical protein